MKKEKKSTQAWGIASLILSILSLFLWFAPYIGIFLAIAAVVFYGIQKKYKPTGVATAGLVIGIIGIIVNGIILLILVGFLALFGLGSSIDGGETISDHPSIETTLEGSLDNETSVEDIEAKEQAGSSIYNEDDVTNVVAEAKGMANKESQKLDFAKQYRFTEDDMGLLVFTPYASTVAIISSSIEKYDEYTLDDVRSQLYSNFLTVNLVGMETDEMYSSWDTSDLRVVIEFDTNKICRGEISDVKSEIGDWTASDWNYKTSITAGFKCFEEIHNKKVRFVFVAGNQKEYFDVDMSKLK